jgi:hypothetical protein
MICALTARKLKPGTFEDFRTAFMGEDMEANLPEGWVRFNMIRGVEDPDEVVCFGFFDGTLEQLRAAGQDNYQEQLDAIAPYVESVGIDGFFDVVEDRQPSRA